MKVFILLKVSNTYKYMSSPLVLDFCMYYVKVGGVKCHVIRRWLNNKNKTHVLSDLLKSLYLNIWKVFLEVQLW